MTVEPKYTTGSGMIESAGIRPLGERFAELNQTSGAFPFITHEYSEDRSIPGANPVGCAKCGGHPLAMVHTGDPGPVGPELDLSEVLATKPVVSICDPYADMPKAPGESK
jgi:hypothetical protein